MTDPVGMAAVHRLGDGPRAGRLAGVHGDAEVARPPRASNARLVDARRPARLTAGEVERDDPAVAVRHRQPGDRQRDLRGVVPERAIDDAGDHPEVPLPTRQPAQLRLECLAPCVSPPRVLSLGQ